MNSYCVRQFDNDGQVLSEQQVEAHDYGAALRQLKEVVDEAWRIEVYDEDGEKVGGIIVDYWRQKVRRR